MAIWIMWIVITVKKRDDLLIQMLS